MKHVSHFIGLRPVYGSKQERRRWSNRQGRLKTRYGLGIEARQQIMKEMFLFARAQRVYWDETKRSAFIAEPMNLYSKWLIWHLNPSRTRRKPKKERKND